MQIAWSLVLPVALLGACAPAMVDSGDPAGVADPEALTSRDADRRRWARYVRDELSPTLEAYGVDRRLVRRVAWFGLSEGIFTIGTNPEYGQPGGRQSPLGMSNCGDSLAINRRTAFPDCFGKEGYAFRSGNWQVGIGGVQVSDFLAILPRVYHALYGDTPPSEIAQPILASLGETRTFPDLTIEAIATRANARWASVVLRDPLINVWIETYDGWITDGRDLGYGKSIIDAVWSE